MAKSRRLAERREPALASAPVTVSGNRPRSATIVLAWSAEGASTTPATIAPSARAARYRNDVMGARRCRRGSRRPLRVRAAAAADPGWPWLSQTRCTARRRSWFPPRRALPGRDIRILAAPTRLAITSVGEQVVALRIHIARAFVDVGPAPRIGRDGLLQVGPAPIARCRVALRSRSQRLKALGAGGVVVVVEPVRFECEPEQLDLRPRGGLLRVPDVTEHHGRHETRENGDDRDHNQELDEGEALPATLRPHAAPLPRS